MATNGQDLDFKHHLYDHISFSYSSHYPNCFCLQKREISQDCVLGLWEFQPNPKEVYFEVRTTIFKEVYSEVTVP